MILNGGTLDLADQNETIGDLSGTAGTLSLGSGTLTLGTAKSTAAAAVIVGSGGLIKQGSGTLTLSGANSYDGETTIDAGVLVVTGDTSQLLGGIDNAGSLIFDQSADSTSPERSPAAVA